MDQASRFLLYPPAFDVPVREIPVGNSRNTAVTFRVEKLSRMVSLPRVLKVRFYRALTSILTRDIDIANLSVCLSVCYVPGIV